MKHRSPQSGLSLLEMTLALGLTSMMLGGVWQVLSLNDRKNQAIVLATQNLAVASAANTYITARKTDLLALTSLNAIGSVARIRVINSDTGEAGVPSLQGGNYLPTEFSSINSFSQTYALYVRREDAGAPGVDSGDRLVGLLITTGGAAVDDNMGSQTAGLMGASGGFIYASANPTAPTAATSALGSAGGWEVNLATDWATISTNAVAGRFATLTSLIPGNLSAGSSDINSLSDGITNYASNNLFMGSGSGNISVSGTGNLGFGVNALLPLTTGNRNIALGNNAGLRHTTGQRNLFIGNAAYENTATAAATTGSDNIAIGVGNNYRVIPGQSETIAIGHRSMINAYGTGVTALGTYALGAGVGAVDVTGSTVVGFNSFNGGGQRNTGVGYNIAGHGANMGNDNTALGSGAFYFARANPLRSGYTSDENVAVGYYAMMAMYYGKNNVAVGSEALRYSMYMSESTAVGHNAMMYANSNPPADANNDDDYITYNTAFGAYALRGSTNPANNTGRRNTAVGMNALFSNTSGSDNTAAGTNSLQYNTTGSRNTAAGHAALNTVTTSNNNTAIGPMALSAYSGTGDGNNTAVGSYALYGNITASLNTGTHNTAVGANALQNVTSGSYNVAAGTNAGNTGTAITTGNFNTLLGFNAGSSLASPVNSTALGYLASITESNQIVLGNTVITQIQAQVTTITAISDGRHKQEIADIPLGLDFINKLHPVQYRLNTSPETLRYGFLAQEVMKALPADLTALVETSAPDRSLALINRDENGERTYHMGYSELLAPLVKALQEIATRTFAHMLAQGQELKTLEETAAAQDKIIAQLEAQLKALKAK